VPLLALGEGANSARRKEAGICQDSLWSWAARVDTETAVPVGGGPPCMVRLAALVEFGMAAREQGSCPARTSVWDMS